MSKTNHPVSESEIHYYLSLQEISISLGTPSETIIEIVNQGIVAVHEKQEHDWQFDNEAYQRIRLALQLNHDLGINMAGAALVIDLLNEIEQLQARLIHRNNLSK